jgi:RHS repeat-associated protein
MLHEWDYQKEEEPRTSVNDLGEIFLSKKESVNNLVTWVYEEKTFVPSAKIQGEERFSIISDYIGRPTQAYNENGTLVWETDYDIYGRLRNLQGEKSFIPFRQLGQYEDEELDGLYYNRFRVYDSNSGVYLSKDPAGLIGGFYMYSYVLDSNAYVDKMGLYSDLLESGMGHHLMPRSVAKKLDITELMNNNSIAWYPNVGENTADLHKQLHRNLIDEGVPFHGSKFTGTTDEFFEKAIKAYDGIETKGFLKIPYTDERLFKNLNPKEALEKLKDLFNQGKIPCA